MLDPTRLVLTAILAVGALILLAVGEIIEGRNRLYAAGGTPTWLAPKLRRRFLWGQRMIWAGYGAIFAATLLGLSLVA